MRRKKFQLMISLLLAFSLSTVLLTAKGCSDEGGGGKESLRSRLEETRARYEEKAEELQRKLEESRSKTRAAESDFQAAALISFSMVLTVFLLLALLLRERRKRKVLFRFLKWLKEKGSWNGKR